MSRRHAGHARRAARGLRRGALALASVVALAIVLGCAPLRPGPADAAAAPADAAASDTQPASTTAVADEQDAEPPKPTPSDSGTTTLEPSKKNQAYRLEIHAKSSLRDLLAEHLDLARFREQPDISPVEVGRLVAAAPAQVKTLLEPEGYFNPKVAVRRTPPATPGAPPTVLVEVTHGPSAHIGRVQLDLQGAMAEAIDGGDKALARRWQRIQRRWALPSGARFTQARWSSAKNALLASLQSRGYPAATISGSGALVDAPSNTVRLSVVVDSGPLFRIGQIKVEGLERTPEYAALNLAEFKPGQVYTEKMLLDYQEALQKSGLYAGVAVELDPDIAQADHATVVARLRENTLQSASLSLGYSTNTGPRVGIEYTHRRPFGQNLVANTQLKLGRQERSLSLDLLGYPHEDGWRNLAAAKAEMLDAGGARTDTQRLRVGRTRDTQRIDRLYYLELNRTTLRTDTRKRTDFALLANYEWVHRDVNNLVFPTRGLILSLQGGAGFAIDGDDDKGPFTRGYLQGVYYQPLGDGWFGQARLELAEVFKRSGLGVPDTLLFRAGGDNSVRGYGYRQLGPVRDGQVVGGPVMATGTLEVMRRISEKKWRDWFGAVFVDAGNAATSWGDLDPVLGYGVGVRWRSPIGPLRVDLAYGQHVHSLRLHVSVGVTF